jgi:RNA polymerase sigma-70 factor (ECF subfamily)
LVFVLFDVQGFSHDEIAAQLGISAPTSRSQLHLARTILRAFLEEEIG